MSDRLFTPRTARQALSKIRPAAERMCRLYKTLQERRPVKIVPEQPVDRGYYLVLDRLHAEIDSIHRGGAQVKDLGRGLLDFPARRGGRQVLLCWRVGEDSLEFWHEPEAGYSGRRPVDDDGPWEDGH